MNKLAQDVCQLLSGLTDNSNDKESIDKNNSILMDFLTLANNIEPEVGEEILNNNQVLWEKRKQLSQLYGLYLQTQEYEALQNLINDVSQGNQFEFQKGGKFAKDAYSRVSDMFDVCDFSACERFVMIGCGPLPVTMLQVLDCTEVPIVVGVDCDSGAVAAANDLFGIKKSKATAICSDGQEFSFEGADIVYIANMCTPKIAVLNAIERTASQGLQVIVREPFSLGRLLAESVEEGVGDAWEIVGRSETDRRFLSRHLFLKSKA